MSSLAEFGTHSLFQCCLNRLHTTLVVELIFSEVRVMSCVYEVVCQRFCHILMNLQPTNKQIGQFSSYEKQHHFIIKKKQLLHLYCCFAQEISELSWPHVHHNSAAAAGLRPRAACRGLCLANRPGVVVATRPWRRATHKGPCPANRPRAAAIVRLRPRVARRGPCPADRPRAASQLRAALAGAGSARFAHNSRCPPFRIWWGHCFDVWHRG